MLDARPVRAAPRGPTSTRGRRKAPTRPSAKALCKGRRRRAASSSGGPVIAIVIVIVIEIFVIEVFVSRLARVSSFALRTERLVLRDWRDDDLDAFAAMNAD